MKIGSITLAMLSLLTITEVKAEVATYTSTDGKRIICPGQIYPKDERKSVVVIWDATTGKQLQTLGSNCELHMAAAITPDGKIVGLCGDEKNNSAAMMLGAGSPFLNLYDAETGRLLRSINCGKATANIIAFSPDGKVLAAGCSDAQIRLFDVSSGKLLKTLAGFKKEVLGLSLTADGKLLAARDSESALKIWDIATGKAVKGFSLAFTGSAYKFAQTMAISNNGKYLASSDGDKSVEIRDVATGKQLRTLGDAGAFAFSPDSTTLVVSDGKGRIKMLDVATGKVKRTLPGHSNLAVPDIDSIQFTGDGKKLITTGADRVTKVWDTTSGTEQSVFCGPSSMLRTLAFAHNGNFIVTGNDRGELKAFALPSGDAKTLSMLPESILQVRLSPDDKTIAVVGDKGTLALYDRGSGKLTRSLTTKAEGLVHCTFSHDGTKLAAGFANSLVKVWDTRSGAVICTVGKPLQANGSSKAPSPSDAWHAGSVIDISFSPDDKLIATASADATVKMWNATSGQFVRSFIGHPEQVNAVFFSSDSKQLISADAKGLIKVWDIGTGKNTRTTNSPDGKFYSIAINSDGSKLATSTWEIDDKPTSVRLWDIGSGQNSKTIPTGTDGALDLSFSPDGRSLAATSITGGVKMWDLGDDKLRELNP